MTERPLLLQDWAVRAVLDGTKTQTRRPLQSRWLSPYPVVEWFDGVDGWLWDGKDHSVGASFRCPFGKVGDRLWVREAWAPAHFTMDHPNYAYRADGPFEGVSRWRPSIHMPRHVSRILLEITDVRVERVQDITEEDRQAEAAPGIPYGEDPCTLMDLFVDAWDSLYSNKPGLSWESNPWCWALTFKRIEP